MLRWILALVVVANLLFLAWSQHWLAPSGLAPKPAGEPYRLQQQVQPEAIVLRPVRPENQIAPAAPASDAGQQAAPADQAAEQPTDQPAAEPGAAPDAAAR